METFGTTNVQTESKKHNEKREQLKSLSVTVKPLVESGAYETVNDAILKSIYTDTANTEFKTLRQWNEEGFNVKKGSKAFVIWGKPKPFNKEEGAEKDAKSEEEETFFPLAYLFSNAQVERRAKNA